MADQPISGLTALTGANTATGDLLEIVDVSDTTMAATGTNKKITRDEMKTALLVAPGPIGGTTPAAGSFTTLAASGTATFSGNITKTSALTAAYAMNANISGYANAYTVYMDGTSLRIGNEVALPVDIQSNASTVGRFSSTGLAVTGALSATNKATIGTIVSGETDVLRLYENGGSSRGDWSFKLNGNRAFYIKPNATDGSSAVFVIENAASTKSFQFGTDTGTLKTPSTISVGNATPSTSGAGITFPATQSASTDPNTLDDYEEGTWTPVYQGIGGTAGTAASTASGTYTKVGREVICKGKLVLTDKGSWTSAVRFEGLPFSTAITQECTGTMTLGNVSYDGSSFAVYVIAGSTNFYVDVSKTAVDRAVLSTSQVAANSSFFFAFTYIQS